MLKIYTASKMVHGKLWLSWQSDHAFASKFIFHARWLKHVQLMTPDTPEQAREFWQQDEQDVRQADVLLCFADQGETLRGALVEVGIAIANNVPVVIGGLGDFGTWQWHPGIVSRHVNVADALDACLILKPNYKR